MADRVEFHWHRSFHSVELIEHNSLSLQAGGLLTRLVHIMFSTREPVKNDIVWITRRTSIRDKRTVRKALDELIEQGVIIVTDAGLTHVKTMQEIENHSAMRAENGSKRSRSSKADVEQSANSSPSDADLMAIKPQTDIPQVIENVGNSEKLLKEENQSQKGEEKKEDSEAKASGVSTPSTVVEISPVKALFDHGVRILTGCGQTEKQARVTIASLRKTKGDAEAAGILVAAENKTNPASYIYGAINKRDRYVPNGCRIDEQGILCTGAAL